MSELEQALKRARTRASKVLPRIQRDTDREVRRLLQAARKTIRDRLLSGPSEYQAWMLPQLERAVDEALQRWGTEAGRAAAEAQARAWQAGIGSVDGPLDAAFSLDAPPDFSWAGIMPAIDTQQLEAMREFMTVKMRGIGAAAADRINTDLGLALLGAQDVETAARNIARVAGSDDAFRSPLARARTVVRTELGRAYSVAGNERLRQASEHLPGLRKQWRRSGALHARITHDQADGQVRPVDEPFDVGGEALRYPRDPAGSAKNTINCGCQMFPWMTSWEMRTPGRQPFSDEERARDRARQRIEMDHATLMPVHLDDVVVVGHEEWVRLVELAGGDVDHPSFPTRFRRILRRELKARRDAGTVEAVLRPASDSPADLAATRRVQQQAAILPASWVRAGNAHGEVTVVRRPGPTMSGGSYDVVMKRVEVDGTRDTALHEYTHHLQSAMAREAMGGPDHYFQSLHRRRTSGEPREMLPAFRDPNIVGRGDHYVYDYFGCELPGYDEGAPWQHLAPNGPAVEVMTTAIESTFYPIFHQEFLPRLVRDDPEMLHLTLGLLFRYDPLQKVKKAP